ncbi:MAG: hypothetical protein AAF787_15980, partial [Chloroflexota bacterium]
AHQTIVPPLQGNTVVPDDPRNVNHIVQMPIPFVGVHPVFECAAHLNNRHTFFWLSMYCLMTALGYPDNGIVAFKGSFCIMNVLYNRELYVESSRHTSPSLKQGALGGFFCNSTTKLYSHRYMQSSLLNVSGAGPRCATPLPILHMHVTSTIDTSRNKDAYL